MVIPAKIVCLGTGSGMTEVTRKLECLVQHGNCRHSLLEYSKLTEWGMKLPARPACLTPLLVVLGIKHSHREVLAYFPGLTELVSVDYFIGTSWAMFSFLYKNIFILT